MLAARARGASTPALLTRLTAVPPDRVGVARQLRLGGTLKPTAAGFELDLRTADAHKTAALFGYSSGRAPPPPPPRRARCSRPGWPAAGLTEATVPYVFVLGGRGRAGPVAHARPVGEKRWTELVPAVRTRQAGVPLAPKDLRSSFITFLQSDANADEALKRAVAHTRVWGSRGGSGVGSRGWCSCGTSHSTHERGNGDVTRHELTV